MTNETHDIKTIQEFFEVANNENFERIMQDFILFANQAVTLKDRFGKDINITAFEWTDDGINELTGIKMQPK